MVYKTPMTARDYRLALDAALREHEALLEKRARLDRRLDRLQETIGSLQRLCGLTPTIACGLTDACRAVLRRTDEPLAPLAVRERLDGMGFDLSRYANGLAAIHTTLKRLARAGEVKPVTGPTGEQAYAFVRVRAMTLEQALGARAPLELSRAFVRPERKN